jgi:hypothetical protein
MPAIFPSRQIFSEFFLFFLNHPLKFSKILYFCIVFMLEIQGIFSFVIFVTALKTRFATIPPVLASDSDREGVTGFMTKRTTPT